MEHVTQQVSALGSASDHTTARIVADKNRVLRKLSLTPSAATSGSSAGVTDWSIRPKNFTAGTYLGAAVLTSTAELAANTEKEFTLTAFEIPKGHAVGFEFVKTGSPTSLAAVHVNVKAEWV